MKCPCCKGKWRWVDVIVDGQGPEELCGYCMGDEGKVGLWKWLHWALVITLYDRLLYWWRYNYGRWRSK